jgi:hypothetical protein
MKRIENFFDDVAENDEKAITSALHKLLVDKIAGEEIEADKIPDTIGPVIDVILKLYSDKKEKLDEANIKIDDTDKNIKDKKQTLQAQSRISQYKKSQADIMRDKTHLYEREYQMNKYKIQTYAETIHLLYVFMIVLLILCLVLVLNIFDKLDKLYVLVSFIVLLLLYIVYLIKVLAVDDVNVNIFDKNKYDFNKPSEAEIISALSAEAQKDHKAKMDRVEDHDVAGGKSKCPGDDLSYLYGPGVSLTSNNPFKTIINDAKLGEKGKCTV